MIAPYVLIESQALEKMRYWVKRAKQFEVSGFGKVLKRPFGYEVVHPILLPQKNSSGGTVIEPKDIGRAMYELRDVEGDFNFWWHSHGYGDTYFSHTDHAMLRMFAEDNYVLATVFNYYGQSHSALYMAQPHELFVENLLLRSYAEVAVNAVQEWETQYVKKTQNFVWKKKGKKTYQSVVPHAQLAREAASFESHSQVTGEA